MKRSTHRRQAGDTIVEVLIAIGVVSLVLTGAFVVSSRSTVTTIDSQEHAQAQQYLQAQVELLRSYALVRADADLPRISSSEPFCLLDVNTVYQPISASNNCNQAPNGNGAAVYKLSATRATDNLYTFSVSWDSISGGSAQESFVYRVYAGR